MVTCVPEQSENGSSKRAADNILPKLLETASESDSCSIVSTSLAKAGSPTATYCLGGGKPKDITHNEMERLRRKEIGSLFRELQNKLQKNNEIELPNECKKGFWPKRMTLRLVSYL